jgi:hypothetical protein
MHIQKSLLAVLGSTTEEMWYLRNL